MLASRGNLKIEENDMFQQYLEKKKKLNLNANSKNAPITV